MSSATADQCRDYAAAINDGGGNAHVYRNSAVVASNTAGTWTLLLPTILPDVPLVAAAAYDTIAQAHSSADDYLAR